MPSAWESKVFKGLTSTMISTFTADDLRRECASQSLITQSQKTKFAALIGPALQNEALLDAVQSGDDRSFHLFLECVRKVGPEANVRAILEKLDQIDKYRAAAESATPVSKTTDPSKQDQATGETVAEDPFRSSAFCRSIQPWLCTLPARDFRTAAQTTELLNIDQVYRLESIETKDDDHAHNSMLLKMIKSELMGGFIKLYKAVKKISKADDMLQRMEDLIPHELR
ncbi:uncharacterized protein LOC135819805 [Sycon ciliatum]|uniref:uncharacterized protein LOC135819805 n=1 Tax=Sycon ciliatum TaxID=27933 RepID=UPI0031F69F5C